MTIDDVRSLLEKIEAIRSDDESAHTDEDLLWAKVLEAIAEGAPNAAELAREALKSRDIDFERWFA